MARKKTETKKVYGIYWTFEENDEVIAMVYTQSVKALKLKIEPFATYMRDWKPVAYQYKINTDDDKFEKLLKELNLTKEDEIIVEEAKPKRVRKQRVF